MYEGICTSIESKDPSFGARLRLVDSEAEKKYSEMFQQREERLARIKPESESHDPDAETEGVQDKFVKAVTVSSASRKPPD